ncbi:hypothetical protein [Tenacibaculum maritimum]|uniref:hypothetical protein n=1 Tax=Tenacibaculum maritimum TaxID=107401 RepID=UPI0012E68F4E|nr:hypothetical protein [Tenacibaculum maritimum]CAA0157250.1 conserved hypothetical protein [Tenacibaculum maritimum]CAA0170443.1 conserved hypothetical protein [Tenacibaculum maritimum]CAA0239415.1 conserved hypothetical protein [Tenacibaculum maritimum]
MMNYKEEYKKLRKEYLQKGGSEAFLAKISPIYSLQNEAKLRFELKRLKPVASENPTPTVVADKKEAISESVNVISQANSLNNLGLISEYPLQLHSVYAERKQQFIKACSLKMQLNSLDSNEETKAFELQKQIISCFDFVDDANKQLGYYREFKRILPTKNKIDFSSLSPTELFQKRNTLRSNVTKRAKTIEKLKLELSTVPQKNKLRLQDKLSKKIEEIEKLKLQVDELTSLIPKK